MTIFPLSGTSKREVSAMPINQAIDDRIEISLRFRQTMEERARKLERDANYDEEQIAKLDNAGHICRQRRLVALERSEALRIWLFLDHARTRLPRPMIAL
ncbi:MAG TPA: hypothetical protein VG844_16830 [Terracidiphilus sp.]|nr:hypothetical protein [Terracidiphilus sp.]